MRRIKACHRRPWRRHNGGLAFKSARVRHRHADNFWVPAAPAAKAGPLGPAGAPQRKHAKRQPGGPLNAVASNEAMAVDVAGAEHFLKAAESSWDFAGTTKFLSSHAAPARQRLPPSPYPEPTECEADVSCKLPQGKLQQVQRRAGFKTAKEGRLKGSRQKALSVRFVWKALHEP